MLVSRKRLILFSPLKPSYRLGQLLPADQSEKLDFSSFLFDNFPLLIIILLGYLSIIAITSIAPNLIHQSYTRIKSLKLTVLRFFFVDLNRLLSISFKFTVLVLSFNLFMFFNRNFLSGGIKTSKVVVNTDEIVDSISKLIHTSKTIGTIFDEKELFTEAPDHSFLYKATRRKKLLLLGLKVDEEIHEILENVRSYCFFSKEDRLFFILSTMAPLAQLRNLAVFTEIRTYFELLGFIYLRANLDDERKRFIHFR